MIQSVTYSSVPVFSCQFPEGIVETYPPTVMKVFGLMTVFFDRGECEDVFAFL